MSRYLRQTVLPQIGADGQERIATAHVLVVGAGGLGVDDALDLARIEAVFPRGAAAGERYAPGGMSSLNR